MEETRKCEHCSKEIFEGHVMFDYEFYLCVECFQKFYDGNMSEYLYDNDYQFYTAWEEGD